MSIIKILKRKMDMFKKGIEIVTGRYVTAFSLKSIFCKKWETHDVFILLFIQKVQKKKKIGNK